MGSDCIGCLSQRTEVQVGPSACVAPGPSWLGGKETYRACDGWRQVHTHTRWLAAMHGPDPNSPSSHRHAGVFPPTHQIAMKGEGGGGRRPQSIIKTPGNGQPGSALPVPAWDRAESTQWHCIHIDDSISVSFPPNGLHSHRQPVARIGLSIGACLQRVSASVANLSDTSPLWLPSRPLRLPPSKPASRRLQGSWTQTADGTYRP